MLQRNVFKEFKYKYLDKPNNRQNEVTYEHKSCMYVMLVSQILEKGVPL